MRKLAVAMALASTALATPALARDNAWYVGVEGGAMLVEDMDLDITTGTTLAPNSASIDHDYGYDFGGQIGYDFGGFRAEVEVGYRSARADTINATAPGIPGTANGLPVPGSTGNGLATGQFDVGGSANALAFMVNGMFDFGDDDGLQGFIGGGAGVARVDVKNVFAGPWLDDSDSGFAWQAIAGVRAPISSNWDVGLKYRFFNADKIDLVDQRARDVETRFRSHSILGTLTYNFGEPAAPPPPPVVTPPYTPPPPPVTPPPVVRPACQQGPYIVYFDWDQSNITPDAASTLDNAISAYQNCGSAQVMLAGHADRSGSATYNVGLSQRRNAAVSAYMTSRGIPGDRIATEAFGETRPKVATLDGVREVQNRRVEVSYGPGSGM